MKTQGFARYLRRSARHRGYNFAWLPKEFFARSTLLRRLPAALQLCAMVAFCPLRVQADGVNVAVWGASGLTNIPPDFTNIVAVATGDGFGLALRDDGSLANWGSPPFGIGVPAGLSNVVQIAVGQLHSLALRSDGTVAAWGYDGYQQSEVPAGLSNVVAVAGGGYHSLALLTDGTVRAWGMGTFGETSVPAGLSNVVAISAGGYYSVALRAEGTVAAWGDNSYCELCVPAGLSNVVAISAGWYHCLALTSGGQVVAWGDNWNGPANVPAGLSNVVAISAAYNHSLALTKDGTVFAWGDNSCGEIQAPLLPTNIVAISAGPCYSTALMGSRPFILRQPVGQATYSGWTVTLQTAVRGDPPLRYVWQHNGLDLPQATNAVLTLTNVQVANAGTYNVRVIQQTKTNRSFNVPLAVWDSAPIILAQGPAYQMLQTGSDTLYSIPVTGSLPIAYQWQANGTNRPAATNSVLALTNLYWGNNATYQLIASNAFGVVASSNLVLDLMDLPTALNATDLLWTTSGNAFGPWNWETNVTYDNSAAAQAELYSYDTQSTLHTAANGPATLRFWWKVYGDPTWTSLSLAVNGATKSSLAGNLDWQPQTIYLGEGIQTLDWVFANWYTGAFFPEFAWLDQVTITSGPTPAFITVPPAARTVLAGDNATFSLNAEGTPPLAFAWELNGTRIPGATSSTLTLSNVQAGNAGVLSGIVSNAYGGALTNASLAVTPSPPRLLVQPSGQRKPLYSSTGFAVTALGSAPMSYQWRFNAADLPAATSNVLALSHLQPAQAGLYDVVVSNAYGSATSSLAQLEVSEVAVWGYGSYGETNLASGLTNILAIAGAAEGAADCLALRSDGAMILWPGSDAGGGSNFIAIAGGSSYRLGLTAEGNVMYWSRGPHSVAGLSNIVALAPDNYGYDYALVNLALLPDGTVVGSARLAGLSNVVALAQGAVHSLALRNDGTVVAWGNNNYGQATVPGSLSNVTAIAAGYYHNLAVRRDGTVVAWGRNLEGQTNVPAWLNNVVAAAGGAYHSLALRSDGTVVAWGSNTYGQTNLPTGLTNVIAIAAGQFHSLALLGATPPVLSASLSNPTLSSNGFAISLRSQSGKVFNLQYTDFLEDGQWTSLPLVAGNGRLLILTGPAATNSHRFYRVQRW